MSLFTQKPKPFQHTTIASTSLTKRKKPSTSSIKKSVTSKNSEDFLSSDEDAIKHDTPELSTDGDEEDSKARNVDYSKSIIDKNIQINETKKNNLIKQQDYDDDDYDDVEDEVTKTAKLLLQKVDKTKQRINTTSSSNSSSNIGSNKTNKTENIDHFIIPKVLSASERAKEKEKLMVFDTNSRKSTTFSNNDNQLSLKIITKLNGTHDWKWLIPQDDLFGKFRIKFAEVYLLPSSSFKILYDGEKIDDNKTCRDLGISDNDTIDIQVSPALYRDAVESAKSFKNINTIQSTTNTSLNNDTTTSTNTTTSIQPTTSSSATVINIVDGINLTTRLNGTHVYKWYISKSQPFAKLRKSFSETYNISIDKVKFIFDGEKIADKDTPSSLDMEENNMIDIKIDKELYDKAILSANANKK